MARQGDEGGMRTKQRVKFTLQAIDRRAAITLFKRLSIVVFSSAFNFDQMKHISSIQKWQNYFELSDMKGIVILYGKNLYVHAKTATPIKR